MSTRGYGARDPLGFTDILLEGLAPDGGLYVPEDYPSLSHDNLRELRATLTTHGYAAFAAEVLGLFIDDVSTGDLLAMCERAYTAAKFGTDDIAPVSQLEPGLWLAHLSEGPTAAFKDMAMQLLAQFFDHELTKRDQRLTIVGATSGDTGSAAEYAMLDTDRVKVFMLSPLDRMSPFQRGQMYGIDDPRVVNIVVPGTFDDCQDLVKQVNADAEFKDEYSIGAVNSINWARIVAQVVYYLASWIRVSEATGSDQVSFTVPSGNFGNILAGHVSRMMGAPILDLVCATNENNVLAEFFDTGVYRVRSSEQTYATSSPSMDISKASNFERFFFDLTGRNAGEVRRLFGEQLPRTGVIDIRQEPYADGCAQVYGFRAGTSTHADRVATIARVWGADGYLIDPHTADAVKVATDRMRQTAQEQQKSAVPMIVTETALPIKFAATIREAIGHEPDMPERFVHVMDAPQHTVTLGGGVDQLKDIISARA
jgi:threonine synthase